MEIKTPAKINIFLNVGKKRSDGFHRIVSLMSKINIFDRMDISPADNIEVSGMDWLPEEDNLIYKAALSLKEHTGYDKGCRIKIDKSIPDGAGLGGGSSDAAAILKSLNKLWETGLDRKELMEIGKQLGSDVNFFLYPGICLARGRGERIQELEHEKIYDGSIVLIMPDIKISTRKVYENYSDAILSEKKLSEEKLSEKKLTEEKELNKIINNFQKGNWAEILKNDLQKTVFKEYPILKSIYNRIKNWGATPLLSGSGSSLFALSDNLKTAESIADIVKNNFGYKTAIVKPFIGE
ncbi:MAG: 4-(cytidine 5'-diphospho)-2-C-methyl-D-erythritol kinase [Elusimicrobia bacterium]|jgi:4-diphosphocytidyl-2-C-methyl-D-erythritol kinase|nr:4-(cytidine 5'-diphospho)-2-C-methyl-D-erythritol kinase [Elusimicrobiota bacterium]